jgi:hypothetical protein
MKDMIELPCDLGQSRAPHTRIAVKTPRPKIVPKEFPRTPQRVDRIPVSSRRRPLIHLAINN